VAYRRIMATVIASFRLPPGSRILDVGCGTGGHLEMLSRFGEVYATEMDQQASDHARAKHIAKAIHTESLPGQCSFDDDFFDLIVLFDVLEHIRDDEAALKRLYAKLKPGGHLLVCVPAFMFLWSAHDDANHHWRRYRKQELTGTLRRAGFRVTAGSYLNITLFPVAVLARFLKRLKGDHSHDLSLPSQWVNRLLTAVFGWERFLVPRVSLPFGVSLMATAIR
jgi:2-polyprenyl-3-methyl-5-hydroxy-6-metoxy-1,4-benzoquinol methylase